MKKHHYLLILLFVGIAAYLFSEARNLKSDEAVVRNELNMLREAVKKSPGATAAPTLAGRNNRPSAIDARKFTDDLADFLKAGSGSGKGMSLDEFMTAYESQLSSAPLAKLKEICDLLERNFPFDQPDSDGAQRVWFGMVGLAAKSDPAWAFAKLEQAAATTKIPVQVQLAMFKNLPARDGETMGLVYANALRKWLDAAQAAGRIEGSDPLVSGLRADIAAAEGDSSTAVKKISQLPNQSQRKAAIEYVQGLQTPDARRRAMEELSTVLDVHNFPYFVKSLTEQQGFDSAREILDSASLTPEKHDLAAATIAGAKIGPETKDRAAWLLKILRSDDDRALGRFTNSWTQGNYTEAANWVTTLPPGSQRDAALKGFIPAAARIDGATAMDWALTVSDPLLRNRLYSEARESWKETDAEQADQYRNTHPLDREALNAAGK